MRRHERFPPATPTDVRDEVLAARLAVEPLDDVTRARLVRNAMEAAAEATTTNEPARRSARTRWLAVAAALVVVLAVGLAVVLREDSGSEPTAARGRRPAYPNPSRRRRAQPMRPGSIKPSRRIPDPTAR